ncbi:uncharacterized protein LOC124156023 isoform X2 [Ischnura elegans]|uniref:uncharacterized protein LOC124156023 isoform X2 n=1 Tax=Ischnura elegans TaxID=197161 RepID=UPI001ED8BCF3|nr:uncharacterized protein LOC124156023 isoform X2 [Ischnura elegans]
MWWLAMSDSDLATLTTDQNGVGGKEGEEQLTEKWKRGKLKIEEVDGDSLQENKLPEKVLGLQNGLNDSGLLRAKGLSRLPKVLSGVDLAHPAPSSPQKTAKLQAQKVSKQRTQIYCCVKCKGRSFSTLLYFHRHLLLHLSQPKVKLTRLPEEEDVCEDPEFVPSGRLQVARKRITVSSHRSPLKFRLMCTNSNNKKDSFKLVKSSTKGIETPENADDLRSPVEDKKPEVLLDSSGAVSIEGPIGEPEGKENDATVLDDQISSPAGDCVKEKSIEGGFVGKAEENKLEDKPGSPLLVLDGDEISDATQSSAPKAKDSLPIRTELNESSILLRDNETSEASSKVNESNATPSNASKEQIVDKGIMRQMKSAESEMEKMQSKSPSVIQSTLEVASDKNGLSSSETECEAVQSEFIPIERLEKDGPPPLISAALNSMIQSAISCPDRVSEQRMLCEACGETVVGDQTALEDHCLCRGHYKCPICFVACASTDALAVHSKESHPYVDLTATLNERKKKSSLRSVRTKHGESSDKDASRDSLSDLSNSPSIPSPSADIRTPPLPSPTGVRSSDPLQNATPVKPRSEVLSAVSRAHEQDAGKRNSPSTSSSAVLSDSPQAANSYPARGAPQQSPQTRLPPGRVSDTMPPPLMRPPNIRNNESQSRSTANVPMQPPPALYKVPTSHAVSNPQTTAALPTIPGTSYIRGIPASGYQPDLQPSATANPFTASASNHLAASAAALNARYQTMHQGYPPGSQPQPGYSAYTQPMQTQQRYQMPPPPYPNQLPTHIQQTPRAAMMPQSTYAMSSSQQAYNQSLLKAQLEQARLQLPQTSSMLQSMQNLQQEHYQQQQLQQQQLQQQQLQQQQLQQQQIQQQQIHQQLFQQSHHQLMQQGQQEQIRAAVPSLQQVAQKRKSTTANSSNLRYHHQAALQNQQQLQSQLQQSPSQPPTKQRRQQRDSIGIPSKQTDSDCEIIAVQQRGEGVPVIQSIQGANASPTGESGSDSSVNSSGASVPTSSESTIHLTDSITLSVRQPPGGSSGNKGHSANAVASILATRGITVTPASGASPARSSGVQRARPSPPPNHSQAPSSPNQNSPGGINSAISISQSSRPPHQENQGFAVPAPVAARPAPRQPPPTDRPPRPPTVDLTDENAHPPSGNSVVTCRLCDKQFPSPETLQQHMHVIHQTRNYFRCTICNIKLPSQLALSNHIKRVHKFGSATGAPPELVIPLVDLKNTGVMARLSSLGINYVISLSQLGMSPDSNTFCIPIMSLDASGQVRNNSISGLMSMGTSAVLPIGPVKSLPAAQQPQSQPQTVPTLSQGNANLPSGAPIRAPPHQYAQLMGQSVPR